MMTISDLYDYDTSTNNLFNLIVTNKSDDELEWLTSDIATNLDAEYYLLHSGDKGLSTLYLKLFSTNEDEVTTLTTIAKLIINKFAASWDRLYQALTAEYSPISNYDMTEHEEFNTLMQQDNTQNLNKFALGTTDEDGSPDSIGATSATTTGSVDNNYRDLTRSGNIGVTTSQQMIESELQLRTATKNLYNLIYNDVDELLANNLY